MPSFSASRLIASTPSEVFALVSNPAREQAVRNEPEGRPLRRHASVEHVDGPKTGEGATYRVHERAGRKPIDERMITTVEYEPGRRVAYRSDGGFGVAYDLAAEAGGTRLTCVRQYAEREGLVGRVAERALDEDTVVALIEKDLGAIGVALRADPSACQASVELPLPPSAVFAFIADASNMARWLTESEEDGGKAEVRHRSGPRVGVDASYDLDRWSAATSKDTYELTTIEYEPDRVVAFRLKGWTEIVFAIEPSAGGSILTELRRPVPNPRGIRQRLTARTSFDPARLVPTIEWNLGRIRDAISR